MTGPGRGRPRGSKRSLAFSSKQSYSYALLPFVVAYGLAGLILCRLPAPERPARPAVRVAS
jgi:hypothetical protein